MPIQWEEPVEFAQAFRRSTQPLPSYWKRALAAVTVAAVVAMLTVGFNAFFFWLHKKDLGIPTYFYIVAPLIAGLFVAFLPYMVSVIPCKIFINEKGVQRNKPLGTEVQTEFWPWETIASATIENVRFGEETFRALVLRFPDDPTEILIGLGKADVEGLAALACNMGVKFDIQT